MSDAIIAARRTALIIEIQSRYHVTLHPHPRRPDAVVVSETSYRDLEAAVWADPRLDALGRGYYLYLGSELDVISAPDWACDPLTVALARLYAVALIRPLRPMVRWLSRVLTRGSISRLRHAGHVSARRVRAEKRGTVRLRARSVSIARLTP